MPYHDGKSTRLNSSHLVILVCRLLLRSEEHTSELQSPCNLVCRLLLEKKKNSLQPTPATGLSLCRTIRSIQYHANHRACGQVVAQEDGAELRRGLMLLFFFFFNETAPPEIYPLSLHDAFPISFPRFEYVETPGSRRPAVLSGDL